jgi:mRNA interferase MazF
MVKPNIQRFDIWLVQLDPTIGSEIRKTRPCVILSPNEMSPLKTSIIAPMTSKGSAYPTRISLTFQGKNGFILLDQLRSIDKTRLVQRLGTISKGAQFKVINCLQEMFTF